MIHEANKNEAKLVDELSKQIRSEFSLVRITQTMLTKSIIDGNQFVSKIFKDGEVFDYSTGLCCTNQLTVGSSLSQDRPIPRPS